MHGWAEGRHLYFALEVSKTPTRIAFFYDDEELKTFTSPTPLLSGRNLKCVLYFNTHADEQIFLKLAISAVNHENAALNLKTELPHWDFDRVHTEARAKWAAQLGKIEIATPSLDQKKTFYTALYHMSLAPTLFDDVNGQYRGLDQHIHTLPPGHHNYSTYSLWDTFRAAHPAYTLIEPTRTPDFVNTLIRMSAESPTGPPVWILQGVDTATMTGYHSASVIAEAVQKNIPGVDPHAAYAALSQRALKDSWRALDLYRAYGYIPADLEGESVSKAFEYCYDDWAVAHLAKKVAKPDIATMLLKRSTNYRNYFDKSTGFMRPKFADGTWANSSEGKGPTPFNPIDIGHFKKWRDYTESNAWQTTFGTQHDPAGLITLFGGSPQFIAKLDELFTTSSTLPADAPIDIAGLVGQYAHGNEPSHHIAYLYVYAGAPHKTQSRVRSLMDTMYAPTIDGIAGNEDCGQMSAWYILSALGFYPVDPVSTVYILGSPLFDHAKVHLAGGKTLEIEVHRPNPTDPYIQAFTLNGVPQKKAWFRHADIAQGGKLTFTMSSAPNPTFATDPTQIPPSLTL
jgi:predicted alpha-1,2-mannosidase